MTPLKGQSASFSFSFQKVADINTDKLLNGQEWGRMAKWLFFCPLVHILCSQCTTLLLRDQVLHTDTG